MPSRLIVNVAVTSSVTAPRTRVSASMRVNSSTAIGGTGGSWDGVVAAATTGTRLAPIPTTASAASPAVGERVHCFSLWCGGWWLGSMADRRAAAKARGCSRWGRCPASSMTASGQPSSALTRCVWPIGVSGSWRPQINGHRHGDAAQLGDVDRQRQGPVGRPDSWLAGTFDQVVLDRRVSAAERGARLVDVEQQVLGRPELPRSRLGCAAEANQRRSHRQADPERPTPDRADQDDSADRALAVQCVPNGDAGSRRETDEDRWRRAGGGDQPAEPLRDAGRSELSAMGLGPSEAGQVGGDDPVAVDQSGDHVAERLGEPTVAVEQHDRRPGTAVEQRRRDAGDLDPAGDDWNAVDESGGEPVGRRARRAGEVHARTCRTDRCQTVGSAVSVRYQLH